MLRLVVLPLIVAVAAPPPAPPSSAPPPMIDDTAPEDDGTGRIVGVLTFEGSSPHAAALSRAMSAAIRRRGHWARGGKSLPEVQTKLGCMDYQPECMAKAGELFGADLVLVGTLRAQGEVHQLEMFLLDAKKGEVQSHVSAAIPDYELSDGSIESKAMDLLAQLWPRPTSVQVADVPPPIVEPREEYTEPGKLRWGREQPAKKWKLAMLGTSAGVAGLGIILTAIALPRLRQGGQLEQELYKEADESLLDRDPSTGELNMFNDIDRSLGGDLCTIAQSSPEGMPGKVTNRDVTEVCRKAERWTKTGNAGIGLMVVGAIGVAAFTTLLFVHRERVGARARIRPTADGVAVSF